MARRVFQGSLRPPKKIHTLRWQGLQAVQTSNQSAGSVAVLVLSAGSPAETIMRMRGEFSAWLPGASVPPKDVLVSAGLILVPEGQGSTVIWDPFNDVNAPWIWFAELTLAYQEHVVDVVDVPTMTAARVVIDNKAMRKGSPDEELQMVVTNTTLGTAGTIRWSLAGRILLGH